MATGILRDLADGAKRLGEIKKEFSDLEFNERILELRQLLVSAQTEILGLREENLGLNSQILTLQDEQAKATELIEVDGFKYDSVEGQPSGLPFCPNCEVKEGKMYRLSRRNENYSRCQNCDKPYNAAANGRVHMSNPPIQRGVRRY